MPTLREIVDAGLREVRRTHTVHTTTLPSGLELQVLLNPPRVVLHRTPRQDEDGKWRNTWSREDGRCAREGTVTADALGWTPWLTWHTDPNRHALDAPDYLIVCDERLRRRIIDREIRTNPATDRARLEACSPAELWKACRWLQDSRYAYSLPTNLAAYLDAHVRRYAD